MKIRYKINDRGNCSYSVRFIYKDPVTSTVIRETHNLEYGEEDSPLEKLIEYIIRYTRRIERRIQNIRRNIDRKNTEGQYHE